MDSVTSFKAPEIYQTMGGSKKRKESARHDEMFEGTLQGTNVMLGSSQHE